MVCATNNSQLMQQQLDTRLSLHKPHNNRKTTMHPSSSARASAFSPLVSRNISPSASLVSADDETLMIAHTLTSLVSATTRDRSHPRRAEKSNARTKRKRMQYTCPSCAAEFDTEIVMNSHMCTSKVRPIYMFRQPHQQFSSSSTLSSTAPVASSSSASGYDVIQSVQIDARHSITDDRRKRAKHKRSKAKHDTTSYETPVLQTTTPSATRPTLCHTSSSLMTPNRDMLSPKLSTAQHLTQWTSNVHTAVTTIPTSTPITFGSDNVITICDTSCDVPDDVTTTTSTDAITATPTNSTTTITSNNTTTVATPPMPPTNTTATATTTNANTNTNINNHNHNHTITNTNTTTTTNTTTNTNTAVAVTANKTPAVNFATPRDRRRHSAPTLLSHSSNDDDDDNNDDHDVLKQQRAHHDLVEALSRRNQALELEVKHLRKENAAAKTIALPLAQNLRKQTLIAQTQQKEIHSLRASTTALKTQATNSEAAFALAQGHGLDAMSKRMLKEMLIHNVAAQNKLFTAFFNDMPIVSTPEFSDQAITFLKRQKGFLNFVNARVV